jgi:hypothetical protein
MYARRRFQANSRTNEERARERVLHARLHSILVIALFSLALGSTACRRSPGQAFGDSLTWQDGTVAIVDYCQHPGSYDVQIEWIGPQGDRKILLKVGDSVPKLSVTTAGDLQAIFCRESDKVPVAWIRATWRDLDGKPIVESYAQYPR